MTDHGGVEIAGKDDKHTLVLGHLNLFPPTRMFLPQISAFFTQGCDNPSEMTNAHHHSLPLGLHSPSLACEENSVCYLVHMGFVQFTAVLQLPEHCLEQGSR